MKNIMTSEEIIDESSFTRCSCLSYKEHQKNCLDKKWLSKDFVEKCIDEEVMGWDIEFVSNEQKKDMIIALKQKLEQQ